MRHLIDAFTEGGIFSYLVLLSGLVGIVLGVLQLALARKAGLIALIFASAAGTLLLGMLGSAVGYTRIMEVMAQASPELKGALMARGVAVALVVTWLGVLLAGIQVFIGSLAATIRVNVRRRDGT
jgi:arginine exporter protein ArgO